MALADILTQLAATPALQVAASGAWWLDGDAVVLLRSVDAALQVRLRPPLVCHLPDAATRLGIEPFPAGDVLELFAFVRPAVFCLPTARGLAEALELPLPAETRDAPRVLRAAAGALLHELAERAGREPPDTARLAATMARGGWFWGDAVLAALGAERDQFSRRGSGGLDVWTRLANWEEGAPPPPPASRPVEPREARQRLAHLIAAGRAHAEPRPTQGDYASAVTAAFLPREREGEPTVVLAEAGTGVGKTLGYVAPASLWAERNQAPVWIATFTRNLQRQIDTELDRLHPDRAEKRRKVVVRKGRENYLCLLNLQEATGRAQTAPQNAVGLGLLARWVLATRDGDMVGGDLPGWLADLVGRARTARLADRRGECIFSACDHYRRCFVEHTIRRARNAEIVIANHALVMIQAAQGGIDDATRPTRYVFDEGHHLFDAADSAFGAHLTGVEASDLRRWLLGAEGSGRRARGLERRISDLIGDAEAANNALQALRAAAAELPGPGWQTRIADGTVGSTSEAFLALVRQQVLARAANDEGGFAIECDVHPLNPGIAAAATELAEALMAMLRPLSDLVRFLTERLDKEAAELDTSTKNRIEAILRSLEHRLAMPLRAWGQMLATLENETPAGFVDWFGLERSDGRELDAGMYRHYVDPTAPFAEALLKQAHGVVVTSATLRDTRMAEPEAAEATAMPQGAATTLVADAPPSTVLPDALMAAARQADWDSAEARTGASHLPRPAIRAAVASPFDYPKQTRIFVVGDVPREMDRVAAAYRELFLAADGGGLGLFTAIGRLRAVRQRLAAPLEAAGIPLYAQHVGGLDAATLVEIFRAEERSCLLGTDAVRDGVDVPGRSLRLIVFDRVPWPRPTILHRARRDAHRAAGHPATAYDDMLTRFRLKQAFGRLIRRADDHGVFVMLDNRLPSRLLGAFPPGVAVERIGLAEAVKRTREFLATS